MIAPWKHRPDIATDQMQAEREAPDVIERAEAVYEATFRSADLHANPMKAAIRVVLEDQNRALLAHFDAVVAAPLDNPLDIYGTIQKHAASIGVDLAPTSEDNQP